jgi:hypothetical protein
MKASRVGQFNPTHQSDQITSFGADVDLTDESGCPAHAAERLEVHNDESSTQDIVLTLASGVTVTREIPADSIRVLKGEFTAIEASGTGTIAEVVAYYWHDGIAAING